MVMFDKVIGLVILLDLVIVAPFCKFLGVISLELGYGWCMWRPTRRITYWGIIKGQACSLAHMCVRLGVTYLFILSRELFLARGEAKLHISTLILAFLIWFLFEQALVITYCLKFALFYHFLTLSYDLMT